MTVSESRSSVAVDPWRFRLPCGCHTWRKRADGVYVCYECNVVFDYIVDKRTKKRIQ